MKAWLIRMVHRQAQLDGQIRWSVQFIVQSVATISFCMLIISLVGYYMIVSGSLEDFVTNRAKDELHHIVDAMGTAIEALVPSDGVIGPDMDSEVQKHIKRMLRHSKYNYPNGYFILFQEGTVVAQGIDPENAGVNRLDAQDYRGAFHVRQLRDAARQGGGFVEYVWKKLDDEWPAKKIAYARPLRGGQWWIASGVYLDSIETGSRVYIDKQGWYLAGLTIGLFALMATLLFVVLQFGSVLGHEISQPVIEQMKGLAKTGDEERSLLAVALHDLVSRELMDPLKPTLSQMVHAMDTTTRQTLKQQASKIIDDFDDKCQDVEGDIYPPSVRYLGVGTAVKHKVREMTQGHDALHIKRDIDESMPRSDLGRECALYRIAQGLLQNVLNSAQATQVHIELAFHGETVTFTIKDNGNGFDVDPVVYQPWKARSRFGIQWMLAQAAVYEGHIKFTSKKRQADSPEHGTTVHVTMRWPKPETKNGS